MGLFSKKKPETKKPGTQSAPVRENRGPQPASWPEHQCWTCGGTGRVIYACPTFSQETGRHNCRYGCSGGNIYKPCDNPRCALGRVDGN